MEPNAIDPRHSGPRTVLRTLGPVLIIVGVILLIVGVTKMFGIGQSSRAMPSFNTPFETAARDMHNDFDSTRDRSFGGFGIVALGMLCTAVGIGMTSYGYMGRVARYVAGEIAPVGVDTFNAVAAGSQNGIRTVSKAIGEGLGQAVGAARAGVAAAGTDSASAGKVVVRCHKCNADNAAGAKFCAQCGAALGKTKPCPKCGELNDPDAKFCDNCGQACA
jgi:ribosomal protein L40E